MMSDFDNTMSYMKAIGIICVVAGHAYTGSYIEGFVGLFHMPLFFFISGYLFKEKYINSPSLFVKRKLSKLYWPTFKWLLFAIVIHNLLYSIGMYRPDYSFAGNIPIKYDVMEFIHCSMDALVLRSNELIFAGIWFLRYLLLDTMLCFLIIKYQKQRELLCACILLLFSIVMSINGVRSVIGGTSYLIPFSAFFYYCGYLWRKCYSDKYLQVMTSNISCLVYVAFLLLALIFWRTGMIGISTTKMIPFIITAFMGIFLVMGISKRLLKVNTYIQSYLNIIGTHTYDVLMMHVICFKLVTLLIILINGETMKEIANYPTYHYYSGKGWFFAYLVIGVNLPLYIGYEYRRIKQLIMKNE